MTDPDRARVYDSEFTLRDQLDLRSVTIAGTTLTVPVERRFAALADVQRYVDAVLALNWVRSSYARAALPLTVKRHKVINEAKCGNGVMHINDGGSRFAMRESVILHELTHHLEPFAGHGLAFRSAYLTLLEELIGPEVSFMLRVNYIDNGLCTSTVSV